MGRFTSVIRQKQIIDCYKCFSVNINKGICEDCGTNQNGPIVATAGRFHSGAVKRRKTYQPNRDDEQEDKK